MADLRTSSEIIDALGGTSAFARWYGVDDRRVSDWRKRGFPSATFFVMSARLKAQKINASPAAWGMVEPKERTPEIREAV